MYCFTVYYSRCICCGGIQKEIKLPGKYFLSINELMVLIIVYLYVIVIVMTTSM